MAAAATWRVAAEKHQIKRSGVAHENESGENQSGGIKRINRQISLAAIGVA